MSQKVQPTIKDVAAKARVSVSTVSRVLNKNDSVQESIRSRVDSAIRDLGYRRIRAGSEKRLALDLVALLANTIDNPFFLPLFQGIESTARLHGLNMLFVSNDNDEAIDQENVDRLQQAGVKGIIQIGVKQAPKLRELIRQGFPVVLLDHRDGDEEVSFIDSSNELGAYHATTYLIKLGHRRIAFVHGPEGIATSVRRFRGYRRALEENGLELDEDLVCFGNFEYATAKRAMSEFLDRGADFSAVFSSNDQMAFGVLSALNDHGVDVPGRVSVVGYDDIPLAEAMSLTTVAQPIYDMGRNAVLLLLDLLSGRVQHPAKIVLQSHLVIRGSCGRI